MYLGSEISKSPLFKVKGSDLSNYLMKHCSNGDDVYYVIFQILLSSEMKVFKTREYYVNVVSLVNHKDMNSLLRIPIHKITCVLSQPQEFHKKKKQKMKQILFKHG